ncbi:MAG: hypothetical protein AB1456_00860 [Thermodesulfobacteriota bacterium]
MASIRKRFAEEEETTVFLVEGVAIAEEIIAAIEEFYRQGCTAKLLWDLSGADLAGLTMEQLRQILSVAQGYGHLRPNGKTAIVVASNLGFGLGRMYEILCELDRHPIPLRVFKTMAEAREWLAS